MRMAHAHIACAHVQSGLSMPSSYVIFMHDSVLYNTVITLNIGTPRPATVVVLNIKQFNFTLK